MSSLLSAELAATCNALGNFDAKSNKYYADENTLETVKDLIRYLRRDDETHDIRRQLGKTKVLETDLLPLLKSYWEEADLFDVLLRLIVNLTTPALVLWNEEIPTDKIVRNYYLETVDHLQTYKEAFTDEAVWAVLSTGLSKILEIEYAERGDENSLIIERILILVRNVLYVPAHSMEKRPDNDASIHDQVLWALHRSGMLDIILYITSSANEQAYYMHIMEIMSYMLREQKASELADANLQRSQTEKIRDEAELLAIRHKETNEKQQKVKKYAGARHSRFGGTFVVQSMKSISDNQLIYHKPLNKLDSLNFDAGKAKPKTPKNRLPFVSGHGERRSAFTIRLFLKEFCVEFLNGSYNKLMYHVKGNLVRQKSQAHDESYYLWAMAFFMEFNRCYKFDVKLVSETMSVQTFHYVQQQSETHFDMMQTDKKKIRLWSRRLHIALLAYRELFHTLAAMDRSPDGTVRDSARVIKSNIFYVPEYREFILTLLVTYDELKMSDVYLRDLLETQHIFLKMFETFCGGKEGSVLVRQKVRGRRHKKKKAAAAPPKSQEINLERKWDEVSQQLSAVLQGGGEFPTDIVPFDATSEVPIDDQRATAMIKVQRKLRNLEFEYAIALLRAAREVWPENDSFGSNNMPPEEEFLAMREIFFADLGENTVTPQQQNVVEEAQQSDDDEDEEDDEPRFSETDLNFDDFIKRLPHPKIVRACGLALGNFQTNSVMTNHCIVKLLHRIAFDCKMYVMVFQLSIFRTFQKIFAMKESPQFKELKKFATYIMRQFFKVTNLNKFMYMESLFWKSKKDGYEIENGYGSYTDMSKAAGKVWSEEEEDELRRLFMEHQNNKVEEDLVDWIVNNLIDNTKSRRIVLKKLKELCLIVDYKKSQSRKRAPLNWSAEEETQLRELYEELKDAQDPLGCIIPKLEISRPKNRVIEKMLVMGLIQDKKELRKKRVRSTKSGNSHPRNSPSESENSASSESESDDGASGTSSAPNTAPRRQPKKQTSTNRTKIVHQKRKKAHVAVGREKLAKLVMDNVEAGHQEPLQWLKESFTDAVEDIEDGCNEGIPLVPIMDYAQQAMENSDFLAMLRAFGICEPFDEQEIYWRIPGHLTVPTLQNYCTLIQEALDGTLSLSPPTTTDQPNEDSEDDDIFERLREINKQARAAADESVGRKKSGSSQQNKNVNDDNKEETSDAGSSHVRKRIRALEDSDEENGTEEANEDMNTNEAELGNIKNHSRIIQSDSEDEESEKENIDQSNNLEDKEIDSKRQRMASGSDTEMPTPKRSRIIDSDDE